MILTLRTDKPEAEVGLYEGGKEVAYKTWEAHRALSSTIHYVIVDLLVSKQKTLEDVEAIIFYSGPGSFTGLRIGAAVANALSVSLCVPLIQAGDDKWIKSALIRLKNGESEAAAPFYGSEPLTTKPKK